MADKHAKPDAKTEPTGRGLPFRSDHDTALAPEDKPRFPTSPEADPHTYHPGLHQPQVRTAGEEAEVARMAREAAADPMGGPNGRSLLAMFDAPVVAKALKIPTHDAERLIDVLFVKLGRGGAEARVNDFVKAAVRIVKGDSVDDVLRDLGRERGVDKPPPDAL